MAEIEPYPDIDPGKINRRKGLGIEGLNFRNFKMRKCEENNQ